MLVIAPARQLWVRFPRVRVSRRSFSIAFRQQYHATNFQRDTMFKKAVDHHATCTATQFSDQQIDSRTNQTRGMLDTVTSPVNGIVGQHHKNSAPLQRTSKSALNALDKRPVGAKPAIKRTASGLAKAFDRSHDPFLEMSHPVVVPPTKDSNTSHTSSLSFFDENDFDSDPDLEVEDLSAKHGRHGKVSPKFHTHQPVTYQHQQKAAIHSHADSTYQTVEDPPAHASSLPLPWSSSAESHKAAPPRARESQPDGNLSTYTQTSSKPADLESRPTKRRTLPWLAEEAEQEQQAESAEGQKVSTSKSGNKTGDISTPASKSKSTQQYPWNTTASAIKAQQKQHRKESKKPMIKISNEDQASSVTNPKRNAVVRPLLSNEQRRVLDLVTEQGKSVFFTGSAGTGKSVLLREIIAVLRKKYQRESDRVAMTASTGLAACNIGGVTLHSFAGIGLGKEPVPELVKKIKRNQKARHRWMRTKVLVIDEISMVDAELFDKLEEIARSMRGNGRPFGGIQLVITGDFFQLPPVPEHGTRVSKFSFDATTWTNSIDHTIALHHVFRQKDPVFASMLNEMREGYLSSESQRAFRGLSREIDYGDSLMATELFPRRNEVDAANLARMRQLVGTSQIFEARDGGTIVDKAARDKLLSNCMAPAVIELKKGAQVMLIKNTDETLVNGTLGNVIGFMNEATFDSYNADEDAYNTIQNAKDDDLNPQELRQKRQMQLTASTGHIYPLVRFSISDGTTRDVLCTRENWKIELPNGEVQASRSQIPLILAWALSIHKAQGQTLERVKVDLRNVFEKGQAYVALSRATSMKGLQVLSFDPAKVMAHERVRQFYSSLTRAEKIGDEDMKLEVEDVANREKKKKAGNITAYA